MDAPCFQSLIEDRFADYYLASLSKAIHYE